MAYHHRIRNGMHIALPRFLALRFKIRGSEGQTKGHCELVIDKNREVPQKSISVFRKFLLVSFNISSVTIETPDVSSYFRNPYFPTIEFMPPEYSDQERWFSENLQPHEAMLRGWLTSRFPSECDIDDVLQESYFRVLKAKAQGELKAPKAFLFATARNLAVDRVRRLNIIRTESLTQNDALTVLDECEDISETISRNQELEILTEAIQALPDRCRRIFTLRKVYAMSQPDIARKMGVSVHTVSAQLTIGVRKCTEFMESRCDGRTKNR